MDYELCEMIANNADANDVGEYLSVYGKQYWRKKYFEVNRKRLYPIYDEDKEIIGWEWD